MRKPFFWTILLASAGMTISVVSNADAQWSVNKSGPDVFGKTTVIAVEQSEDEDGLVIQCNQKDMLEIALISPATASELDQLSQGDISIPATLLIKVDNSSVMTLNASMRAWNNTHGGVVASGRSPDLVSVVKAIGSASSRINVGVQIGGQQQADSFDVGGSTSAMATVMKGCDLADIQQAGVSAGSGPSSQ